MGVLVRSALHWSQVFLIFVVHPGQHFLPLVHVAVHAGVAGSSVVGGRVVEHGLFRSSVHSAGISGRSATVHGSRDAERQQEDNDQEYLKSNL